MLANLGYALLVIVSVIAAAVAVPFLLALWLAVKLIDRGGG